MTLKDLEAFDPVTIQCHDNPDADALGAGFGLYAYFKSLGSYYIYDSRTISVAQQNVGDYYSYNTHDLLEGWNIHLAGEYLVYVGIDTTFPAADVLSAAAQKYQEADQNLQPYILPMVAAAVLLVVTAIWILVLLLRFLWNMA